jgi:nucleotide-binding universal stress UspA family protein
VIAANAPVEIRKPAIPRAFKRILVAVTQGAAGSRAVNIAAKLSSYSTARVKVLHLQERVTYPSRAGMPLELETYQEALEFTARVQADLRELGVDAPAEVGRVVSGKEAAQILQAAGEFCADLIIVGNRPKSALCALLTGSTTRDIVRQSGIPILLVPEAKSR